LPERKGRGQDGAVEFLAGGDPDSFLVQKSAGTPAGSEQFIADRIVDGRVFRAALVLVGDRDGKMRNAVQEVAGAVQWVNDPQRIAVAGRPRFLAQKGMIGVETPDFPYNLGFTGPVHLADVVVAGFALHRDRAHVVQLAAHDGPGGVGGFDRDIENRMRHD
jgi:hypothetical protein